MIQRIQTLYLFLAALTGAATWVVPFGKTVNAINVKNSYLANDNFFLAALIIIAVVFALINIFIFKNRRLQLRFSILGMIISLGCIVLEYFLIESRQQTPEVQRAYYWIGIALPILMIIFFFLAARGIYKDEKLVKSLDRLR